MKNNPDLTPVGLRYTAALRGIVLCNSGLSFKYARFLSKDSMNDFIALAASNPEGWFFGIVQSEGIAIAAREFATSHGVRNTVFIAGNPSSLCENSTVLPKVDIMVVESAVSDGFVQSERVALCNLLKEKIDDKGIVVWEYGNSPESSFDWLTMHLASAVKDNAESRKLASDITKLATRYFADRPDQWVVWQNIASATDAKDALHNNLQADAEEPLSLVTARILEETGFVFVGDANVSENYMELSSPTAAHDIMFENADSDIYEVFKDVATNRQKRADIWCRETAFISRDLALLFGDFSFGLTQSSAVLPSSVQAGNLSVDLSSPPYAQLIEILDFMPSTIGDCISHDKMQGVAAELIFDALHFFVALGIARPMRSSYQGSNGASAANPQWSLQYNASVAEQSFCSKDIRLASATVGGAINVPLREALVLQAVVRGGTGRSVVEIMSELKRLAEQPALAAYVTDVITPTPDSAANLVRDVLDKNMLRWYALGLLAS